MRLYMALKRIATSSLPLYTAVPNENNPKTKTQEFLEVEHNGIKSTYGKVLLYGFIMKEKGCLLIDCLECEHNSHSVKMKFKYPHAVYPSNRKYLKMIPLV